MKMIFAFCLLFCGLFSVPAFAQLNPCSGPNTGSTLIGASGTLQIIEQNNSSAWICYSVHNGTTDNLCAEALTPAMWTNFYGAGQANIGKTYCATTNGACATNLSNCTPGTGSSPYCCSSGIYVDLGGTTWGTCSAGGESFQCVGWNGGTTAGPCTNKEGITCCGSSQC